MKTDNNCGENEIQAGPITRPSWVQLPSPLPISASSRRKFDSLECLLAPCARNTGALLLFQPDHQAIQPTKRPQK